VLLHIALAVVLFLLTSCDATSPADRYVNDAVAVKRGKMIYTGSCGGYCHSNSRAARDAPNLLDCSWRHGGSDEAIFNSIANGIVATRMIGFAGKLPDGDNDIWKIVAFLKSARSC
jgi:mono/diheme cytochrome c family protein